MSLPLIAIAGGSSQLGRAILVALLAAGKYKPVVLSRESSKTPDWLAALDVEIRRVDYLSIDSCASALENVHTVISTLLCRDGTWYTCQKNLLDAGLKQGLKRYVPSEWGTGPSVSAEVDLFGFDQIPMREALQAAAREHSSFEWTAFYNGLFTNYLGYGSENEEAVGMYYSFMFNVKDMTASVPAKDDGSYPDISFTTMADVGRFVAAACELEHGSWPEESYFAGDTLNAEKVVGIIEDVRGSKMTVTKLSKDSLKAQIDQIPGDSVNEEEILGRFFAQLTLVFADDSVGRAVMAPNLNRLFPEIKPTTVEKYMKSYW